MEMKTPITDEWLASVDFKWRQNERQPNKHWKLVCNVIGETSGCIEPCAIEVQRCGWKNDHGDDIGDDSKWMLWITDRFERNAFIREILWCEEITALAEIVTGRPWNPETHIHGQAWPNGSKALIETTGEKGK